MYVKKIEENLNDRGEITGKFKENKVSPYILNNFGENILRIILISILLSFY